jgi:hypothetical protein
VGDRDGRLRLVGRDVQQLRDRAVCPPRPEQLLEGIIRLHEAVQAGVPPAYELRSVAS